ncbi:hypothetical protein KUIN1_37600 [Pseudomonas sp. KUIN-1]|nr:hypothetical protein KUIN1_37600 [Pseudomonas sp. KUIN-1]
MLDDFLHIGGDLSDFAAHVTTPDLMSSAGSIQRRDVKRGPGQVMLGKDRLIHG